ncbi:AAA family ATPase [Ruminococcaceae bacterium OttesenSCG-928-N02]|nr:AAA family ATPase [Ruminococcaceae bacterium OttesenSCG-928-N02]
MAAKIIMVASGKGGTGKSTVSVFTGCELAAQGARVLLIELDSGLRSVDIMAGVSGEAVYDIADILSGRCPVEKAVLQSTLYPGFFVICAPYSGGDVKPEALAAVCKTIGKEFDYILIDTAAGLGAPFVAAMAVANMALLISTPDKICLRDARLVADQLFGKGIPCRLIINRLVADNVQKAGLRDLDECIDTAGAQLIGILPQDTQIHLASATGAPLPPSCKVFFSSIARRIRGEYVPLNIY